MKIRKKDKVKVKQRVRLFYGKAKEGVNRQLWLELLFMVMLAMIASFIVFLIVSQAVNGTDLGTEENITYDESRDYVQEIMLEKVAALNNLSIQDKDIEAQIEKNSEEYSLDEHIRQIIDDEYISKEYVSDMQTYLVDGSGKLIYQDDVVNSIDLIKVIQKADKNQDANECNKFIAIYPVTINNNVCYLYNESTLEPFYHRKHTDLGNVLGFLAASSIFVLIIFRMTRDKIAYIEYLSSCLGEISKGNLNYHIDIVGEDELAQVANSITHMEEEIKYQMEAQIKVEQSKNELVTNVAHDLRTPLTSIIGYIGLVKQKAYQSEEEADKYLEIAYNKSEKLKYLIEDLFELTKLHQRGIKLNKTTISLSNLLHQLIEELMPLASDKQIEMETYIESANTTVYVDIDKITRLFENLIENAIKYCPEGETIYVELRGGQQNIYAAVSNPAEQMPQEEIDKFFERFYRADKSRNSSAGGSGLGLAIAKNIVELHGGRIKAELNQDLISFKVFLPRNLENERQ